MINMSILTPKEAQDKPKQTLRFLSPEVARMLNDWRNLRAWRAVQRQERQRVEDVREVADLAGEVEQ